MSMFWDGERSSMEIAERDTDAGTQEEEMRDAYYYEDVCADEEPEASPFERWWHSDSMLVIRKSGEVDEGLLRMVCGLAFNAGREA